MADQFNTNHFRSTITSTYDHVQKLKESNESKDIEIRRLRRELDHADTEVDRVTSQLRQTQDALDQAQGALREEQRTRKTLRDSCAIWLKFRPTFPTTRGLSGDDSDIVVVVYETAPLERATWEIAERVGKYYYDLAFTFNNQAISTTERVCDMQLMNGDVVEVHFTGTTQW